MKNPYWNRNVIKDPKDFSGRKKEIRQIFDAIGIQHPQSILILGERKTGKSSLLNYILHSKKEKQKLPHPERYIFAFVDFQKNPNITVNESWEMLYKELKGKLPKRIRIERVKDYETFADMVETLDNLGYKLILLFDEIDSILMNKKFEEDFFSYHRSLANEYDVAYIVSMEKGLEKLPQELLGSPFFNIFITVRLGSFQKDEALELITGPSAKEGISLEDDIDFILKNAGLFPFFIQILCSALFEYKKKHGKKIDKKGYKQVLEKFREKSTRHFKYYWGNFSLEEKGVLIDIARGKEVKEEKRLVVGDLMQKGYITTVNGRNQIFNDVFKEYIRNSKKA